MLCRISRAFKCAIISSFSVFAISLSIIYIALDDTSRTAGGLTSPARKTHLLCVLIPYRDRLDELNQMVPHLDKFLNDQSVHHQIIVLNQTDEFRFNRASLINVGWFEADRLNCDFMCMHDVDLLPLNPHLVGVYTEHNYSYPGKGIIKHISSGEYHPIKRYDYKKFIGGVLMLTIEDYRMVDGMSNLYWGWGLEDDEFYVRLSEANLRNSIVRPTNLTTDRSNTFMHIHPKSRKRDNSKTKNQKQMSRKRDRLTGLHSVRYKIKDRSFLHFGSTNASVLHIDLECDLERTPFCLLKSQSQ